MLPPPSNSALAQSELGNKFADRIESAIRRSHRGVKLLKDTSDFQLLSTDLNNGTDSRHNFPVIDNEIVNKN